MDLCHIVGENMSVNLDKPQCWKEDTKASVDHYNKWFMRFAPKAFRETRIEVTEKVEQAIINSNEMRDLSPDLLLSWPGILPTLRMSCCPPLAVDRLVGLAYTRKSLVTSMEKGKLAVQMSKTVLETHLENMLNVIRGLLDPDIFVWIPENRKPTRNERHRASTIVADRLCRAPTENSVRNARRIQQLSALGEYLDSRGYREVIAPGRKQYEAAEPSTYTFFVNVPVAIGKEALLPIDAVAQPNKSRADGLPVLIQTESHDSFARATRHRSAHLPKVHSLRLTYGNDLPFLLLLGGYCGPDYLGTQAAEGIEWVWQHRIADLHVFGL